MGDNQSRVELADAVTLLNGLEAGCIDAIITSPPYIGLPGRGDTVALVSDMLAAAKHALSPNGIVAMIVGPSPGHLLLPFDVASIVAPSTDSELSVTALYVWDRTGSLKRDTGTQTVSHDTIIIAGISGTNPPPLADSSVIRTQQEGFDYGLGVTTPPILAEALVKNLTAIGDWIVDPFCGLSEIGVQATKHGRRFIGGDIDETCVQLSNQRLDALSGSLA